MLFIMGKIPVPGIHLSLPSAASEYVTDVTKQAYDLH